MVKVSSGYFSKFTTFSLDFINKCLFVVQGIQFLFEYRLFGRLVAEIAIKFYGYNHILDYRNNRHNQAIHCIFAAILI